MGTSESNASDACWMQSARCTVSVLAMHPPAQSSVLLPWIRQQAVALSPQGGTLRVLEVGAGDGRLAHFLAEALGDPVAAGNGSAPAAGGTSRAESGGCPGNGTGRSAHLAGRASAPAAAPQIVVTASDDGSLGLHVSSPYRRESRAASQLRMQGQDLQLDS